MITYEIAFFYGIIYAGIVFLALMYLKDDNS